MARTSDAANKLSDAEKRDLNASNGAPGSPKTSAMSMAAR